MIKKFIISTYFLGMGLVSSGIVLMPFNITRYSAILITGLVLFISGSIFSEVVINKNKLSFSQIIKLTIVTLTLAIGIGMISGGISHFILRIIGSGIVGNGGDIINNTNNMNNSGSMGNMHN